MKKILVPIDFTAYSNNAFRLATYIARTKGMAIKLLHIIEEPTLAIFGKSHKNHVDEMEAETREHLKRLVTLENTNELPVDYEIRRTKAGVAKEIMKEDCDLIIMGRKRPENQDVYWTGSVAEKVMRLSGIPVMTVSDLPDNYSIRKIVFANSFNEEEGLLKPIVKRVFDLSRIFNAELFFLSVVPNREFLNEEKAREKVREATRNYDLGGHEVEVYFAPTPEDGISDYMDDADPDLIVVCTHGRRGILHFFMGSTAENVANYSRIPVLSYNINEKKIDRSTERVTRETTTRRKRWEKV